MQSWTQTSCRSSVQGFAFGKRDTANPHISFPFPFQVDRAAEQYAALSRIMRLPIPTQQHQRLRVSHRSRTKPRRWWRASACHSSGPQQGATLPEYMLPAGDGRYPLRKTTSVASVRPSMVAIARPMSYSTRRPSASAKPSLSIGCTPKSLDRRAR